VDFERLASARDCQIRPFPGGQESRESQRSIMDGGGTFTYFAFASASSDLAIAVGSSRESMSGRFAGLSSVIGSPFLFCFFPSVFPSAILNFVKPSLWGITQKRACSSESNTHQSESTLP